MNALRTTKKYLYIVCIGALFNSLLYGAPFESWSFTGKNNESFNCEWITEGSLDKEEDVFKRSFSEAYKNLSPEKDLRITNLEQFLRDAFADERKAVNNKQPGVFFITVKKDKTIVAFMSLELENKKNIYIRQMAVDPTFKRKGIGVELVSSIKKHFPSVRYIKIVTRRVNAEGCLFYESLDFKPSSYKHEGLNPNLYCGYELSIMQNKE